MSLEIKSWNSELDISGDGRGSADIGISGLINMTDEYLYINLDKGEVQAVIKYLQEIVDDRQT